VKESQWTPRIFIGLFEVAGYAARLRDGFESLGVHAVQVDLSGHPFLYPRASARPRIVRLAEAVARRRLARRKADPVRRGAWFAADYVVRAALFCWVLARFEVIILTCGLGFFRLRELLVLRILRKRIILVFFGTDTRPPYMNGVDLEESAVPPGELIARTRRRKHLAEHAERYADACICHPLAAHFFERPFVGFVEIGIPIPPARERPLPARSDGTIRIVHAPSKPELKGSREIREAVESLRLAGLSLEYVEVVGRPHTAVMDALVNCDLVVDQLYSDSPMAGFAAEAAALGRPAIVGSYDWPEIERHIAPDLLPPSHRCHPNEIEAAIRRVAEDSAYREDIGRRAARFVWDRWTPEDVASRYLRLIRGDIPAEWLHDPQSIRYRHGWGVRDWQSAKAIASVVRQGGPAALAVHDKPALELILVEASAD